MEKRISRKMSHRAAFVAVFSAEETDKQQKLQEQVQQLQKRVPDAHNIQIGPENPCEEETVYYNVTFYTSEDVTEDVIEVF